MAMPAASKRPEQSRRGLVWCKINSRNCAGQARIGLQEVSARGLELHGNHAKADVVIASRGFEALSERGARGPAVVREGASPP